MRPFTKPSTEWEIETTIFSRCHNCGADFALKQRGLGSDMIGDMISRSMDKHEKECWSRDNNS